MTNEIDREKAAEIVREWSSLFTGKVANEATYANLIERIATFLADARAETWKTVEQVVHPHIDCELSPRLVRETIIGYHLAARTIANELAKARMGGK